MKLSAQHIGAIGETIVLTQLLWHGWAPVNVNALISQAPNIDLLAAKGSEKLALQIKTAGPGSRKMLQLGQSKTKQRVFNSKDGPLADFIIFVRLEGIDDHECYVVPTAVAERVAQLTFQDWIAAPKKDGSQREQNFPYCIALKPIRTDRILVIIRKNGLSTGTPGTN